MFFLVITLDIFLVSTLLYSFLKFELVFWKYSEPNYRINKSLNLVTCYFLVLKMSTVPTINEEEATTSNSANVSDPNVPTNSVSASNVSNPISTAATTNENGKF